jgi:hypothetical protein
VNQGEPRVLRVGLVVTVQGVATERDEVRVVANLFTGSGSSQVNVNLRPDLWGTPTPTNMRGVITAGNQFVNLLSLAPGQRFDVTSLFTWQSRGSILDIGDSLGNTYARLFTTNVAGAQAAGIAHTYPETRRIVAPTGGLDIRFVADAPVVADCYCDVGGLLYEPQNRGETFIDIPARALAVNADVTVVSDAGVARDVLVSVAVWAAPYAVDEVTISEGDS